MTMPPKAAEEAIDVLAADAPPLLHIAQHFRYAVLVGDLGGNPHGADHQHRIVVDALDESGSNFLAFKGAAIVGAVRVNVVADGGADAYSAAYGLDALGPDYQRRTAIVTRLVSRAATGATPAASGTATSGARGGGAVLTKLLEAILRVVEARSLRWIAIGADAALVEFYRSMGFAEHRAGVMSPSGERRDVLIFDMEDPRHAAKKSLAGWLYPALFSSTS